MEKVEADLKAGSLQHLVGKTFNKEENQILQPKNKIMKIYVVETTKDFYDVEILYFSAKSRIAFHESYGDFLKTHRL